MSFPWFTFLSNQTMGNGEMASVYHGHGPNNSHQNEYLASTSPTHPQLSFSLFFLHYHPSPIHLSSFIVHLLTLSFLGIHSSLQPICTTPSPSAFDPLTSLPPFAPSLVLFSLSSSRATSIRKQHLPYHSVCSPLSFSSLYFLFPHSSNSITCAYSSSPYLFSFSFSYFINTPATE